MQRPSRPSRRAATKLIRPLSLAQLSLEQQPEQRCSYVGAACCRSTRQSTSPDRRVRSASRRRGAAACKQGRHARCSRRRKQASPVALSTPAYNICLQHAASHPKSLM
ncbi:hypothetical protein FA09DRAFT_10759 [Tilletiopsis washingtonensis]|uniref:Uncharacterized protein n=1 Tax=Tilletiopsis washingtonensis TaxID=58919 RepID=A0A316ZIH1_9BASI|nr:hypothetical protein FA09DRAFT_10759 [Tilletiopsis washingtonensis]PWO01332.1 hypothetical protein FA09DRAFT_10759 [Tilletiopsis washingtonensis]